METIMETEVERLTTPRTYKVRVVLQAPTGDEVRHCLAVLAEAGAPPHAVISFNPWATPNDRYYIVATWTEDGN